MSFEYVLHLFEYNLSFSLYNLIFDNALRLFYKIRQKVTVGSCEL